MNRFSAPFGPISAAVVALVFVIPFFGLLTRPPKMVPAVVAFFAGLILLGHWLERFLISIPSIWEGTDLPLGLPEIAIGLGFMGLFLTCYLWFVRTFPMLPSPASLEAAGAGTRSGACGGYVQSPLIRVAAKESGGAWAGLPRFAV